MITRRSLFRLLGLGALTSTASANASIPESLQSVNDRELHDWSKNIRYPVTESNDPVIQQLLTSSNDQQPLAFYYFGGSNPRQLRLATVESVFTITDAPHRYISAYCHLRREHRTFRVDRISLA
jgi:predicted DNA-binding transcriptional regulator YafY